MVFEPNRGQSNSKVKFLSRGSGYSLFLTNNEAVMALRSSKPGTKNTGGQIKPVSGKPESIQSATLRMKFVGSNQNAKLSGVRELPGKTNYYIGNNPNNWQQGIPNYSGVRYEGLYPGVDLVYYGSNRQLEYDLVVAAGADPSAITMAVDGADEASLDDGDDITLDLQAGGKVVMKKPVIYQDIHGVRKEVAGHYVVMKRLNAQDSPRPPNPVQIKFELASYNHSLPLIIDPPLNYSTFLGGNSFDGALGIAADSAGNAYVVGTTFSSNFPTTIGSAFNNGDAFVTKLNPGGTAAVYSTFLGGSGSEDGFGIAIDGAGNAYVTGDTYSHDFPATTGAYDTTCGGDGNCNAGATGDAFVAKLNSTGAIAFATYFGGNKNAAGYKIAVDSTGKVAIAGVTDSPILPIQGGFQSACGSCGSNLYDAFVAQFDAAGANLLYSSFLGGNDSDRPAGITYDPTSKIWVIGSTDSTDFPTTLTAPFPSDPDSGLASDVFIAAIDPTLNSTGSLLFSTYIGDVSTDFGAGLTFDSSGMLYIVGVTDFAHIPTEVTGFQPNNAGGSDVFVAKINPTTAQYVYATLLGGSGDEGASGIAVDSSGNVYVTGSTNSPNFPLANAVDSTYNTSALSDAFVAQIAPDGQSLVFSTYLGGEGDDGGQSIAVNSSGSIFVAGTTNSADFPASAGVLGTACGDTGCTQGDGFVAVYGTATAGGPQVTLSPTSLDFGNQVVSTTSSAQTITLHNTGTATLNLTSISVTGSSASSFSQTNTCGSSVAADATCTISTTFTPGTTGSLSAAVTIESDAASSPDAASLDGNGVDLTIGAASGGSTTASVAAGSTATYTLAIQGSTGVTGNATLACTGAPTAANCTVNPTSVTLSDTTPSPFTVSVTTSAPALTVPSPKSAPPPNLPDFMQVRWLLMAALLALAAFTLTKARRARWLLAPALLMVMVWTGCGSSGPKQKTGGTPAGTYTLTITASTAAGNKTTSLTLTVH